MWDASELGEREWVGPYGDASQRSKIATGAITKGRKKVSRWYYNSRFRCTYKIEREEFERLE